MKKAVASKTKRVKEAEASTTPAGMTEIESKTKVCSDSIKVLQTLIFNLEQELDAIKSRHRSDVMAAVERYRAAYANLNSSIEAKPELFVKPRTFVFHNIKIGMQKPVGKLVFEDEEKVVALIKKHFDAQFNVLVSTRHTLNKDALGRLAADDLKKIGGTVKDTTDQVVIKPMAGDVEKMVAALIADNGADQS